MSEFEGAVVVGMQAKIPSAVVDMDESFVRGTHLRMEVEFRVKNVSYLENRDGDLVRQHVLVIESIALKSQFDPVQANDVIGGSAAGASVPDEALTEELGMRIGRSSELWGSGPAPLDESVGF